MRFRKSAFDLDISRAGQASRNARDKKQLQVLTPRRQARQKTSCLTPSRKARKEKHFFSAFGRCKPFQFLDLKKSEIETFFRSSWRLCVSA
jgi:hypothetical protein